MDLSKITEKEREFLSEHEIPCNEHGSYIFKSFDEKVITDLQFFLLEYKEWLIEHKIVKQL